MALGDVVRLWRQELGWKQVELARRSGGLLSQANISDLERNKYPSPSIETLEGVAVAFGVSVDTLLRASRMAPEAIPSVAEALPPETAGLPAWVRDFHRWGTRMTPAQRRSVLDLARTLAEEAARQAAAEEPPDVETDEESAKGR